MKYFRIMSRVLNQPLLMTPSNLTAFVSALTDRVGIAELQLADGTTLDRDEMRATAKGTSGRQSKPYMVDEGVAIVPVVGTLVNKSGMVQPYSGMTGYDSIEARVWEAIDDPNVDSILLDIDSGGGEVSGCFDCSDFLNEVSEIKPIWAYAGELAASAAFAIGSAAEKLYLPRTGTVGSVGVVVAHQSYEGALDEAGIKVTLIHSGEHKVEGNPYEDLSKEVKADIQGRIDSTRQLFAERVAAYRGMTVSAVMDTEAGVYSGSEAVSIGFADGVATFNEVLTMLKNKDGAVASTGALAEVVADEVVAEVVADEVVAEIAADAVTSVEEIAEFVNSEDAADLSEDRRLMVGGSAVAVITLCGEAGFPQLSNDMIVAGLTVEQVEAQLAQATQINDLCVAAGVDSAEILANFSDPVALARAMIALHAEAEIDSTHSAVIADEKPSGMTNAEIWKHRESENSANRH